MDPARIGFMGFSAGGEVAALVETRFDAGNDSSMDAIERVSSRPDFAVVVYPGFRPGTITVPKDAPPTFLVCADDDRSHVVTTVNLYLDLEKQGVSSEMHIYASRGHGFWDPALGAASVAMDGAAGAVDGGAEVVKMYRHAVPLGCIIVAVGIAAMVLNRYAKLVQVSYIAQGKDSMASQSFVTFTFRYLNAPADAAPIEADSQFSYYDGAWHLSEFSYGCPGVTTCRTVGVYNEPARR